MPAAISSGYRLTLIAILLGILNHIVLNRYEPTKKTFYRAATILLLEPLCICIFHYVFGRSLSLPTIAIAYISFYTALITSVVLYRLSPFHPLAHVPGPASMKISKFYSLYVWWKGDRHLRMERMHEKYGPVVRIAPNEISVIDLESLKQVLGPNGLPKGQSYAARRDDRTEGSLLALTGEARVKRRRLWTRGLSPESIRNYEDIIRKQALKLLDRLTEERYHSFELGRWLGYFTFDFIVDMAFGSGSYMLDTGDDQGLSDTMEHAAFQIEIVSHVPWLATFFRDLPFGAKPALRIRDVGIEWASRRAKMGSITKDLWYHLTDEEGLEKHKPSLSAVISDGVLAIMAGADTTTAALRHFFYLMLSHPGYYRQLQEEIDRTFPSGSDALDPDKHCSMPFLNACLNETLRVLPPLPTAGLREVPYGSGGKMIGGYYIPEGTQVHVPPHSVHRNPDHFSPKPSEFIPSRWLEESHPHRHVVDAFIPFSYGPENCIGKSLAKREIRMVICLLMHRLDFQFAPGFDWEDWPSRMKDYFVYTKEPLMITVTPRTPPL